MSNTARFGKRWTTEVSKGDEANERIRQFLDSDTYKDFPHSRITALAWAAICQAAALGQKKPPNAGMGNDIRVLTLLPYCDAVFVDNGCRALWEKVPRRYRPSYAARIFSYNTKDQLLAYLQEVEDNGDAAVMACVREMHGEPRPNVNMYEPDR